MGYEYESLQNRLTSVYDRDPPGRDWELPEHIRLGAFSHPLEPAAFWSMSEGDSS